MKYFKNFLKLFVPKKYELSVIYYYLLITKKLESEMFFVKNLCVERRNVIDVGANIGLFSYFFGKYFDKVFSFEPLFEINLKLINANLPNIEIRNYALSNKNSSSNIYIPKIDEKEFIHSRASLNKHTLETEVRQIETRRLDDFDFQDIDLIKIDVEGHEMEVIDGGKKTIKKFMPVMLVELEERHLGYSPMKIISKLEKWGYECYVLQSRKLKKAKGVKFLENQRSCIKKNEFKGYINNFIFVPK